MYTNRCADLEKKLYSMRNEFKIWESKAKIIKYLVAYIELKIYSLLEQEVKNLRSVIDDQEKRNMDIEKVILFVRSNILRSSNFLLGN